MTEFFRLSDIIASVALLVSAYAAWRTLAFQQRQKSLIEVQERLQSLLLQKEQGQSTAEKRADLGASIVKMGNSNYRLKVFNKGKSPARNVNVTFPDGNDLIPHSEISRKFPLESLEAHQSVELIAAVHMQTRPKHRVDLSWSDDAGDNSKTVYATI
jgi:hypothetical protein